MTYIEGVKCKFSFKKARLQSMISLINWF
uniref:Uncharacterized protein n=1 Tax=Rhizophora mucronata TaxID=61149 RepID=A0A2P2QJX3_RHIMU